MEDSTICKTSKSKTVTLAELQRGIAKGQGPSPSSGTKTKNRLKSGEKLGLVLMAILFLIALVGMKLDQQRRPQPPELSASEQTEQSRRDRHAENLNKKYERFASALGSPIFSADGKTLSVYLRRGEKGRVERGYRKHVEFWAALFANWDGETATSAEEQKALCDLGFYVVKVAISTGHDVYDLGCPQPKPPKPPRPRSNVREEKK